MTADSAADRDDAAAEWALRLEGAPLSIDEQRALDAWLEADERCAGALLRAEAALAYLDRGRALSQPEEPTDEAGRATFLARRAFLIGGALSGLAAAGIVGALLMRDTAVELQTAIGEVRRVPLGDGSIASINTNSKLAVTLLPSRRQVKLASGEAWFQVAHDEARPFVVEAGDVRVRAVGTAFSVRRREGGVDILVTEGVVEAWVVGHEDKRTRIGAGCKSFVADDMPTIAVIGRPAEIDRQLAWRTGELVLNGENLDYAVSEFNRYNRRKLVVGDADLGREPLIGYFRTDQPEQFGQAAAKLLGARAEVHADIIMITR